MQFLALIQLLLFFFLNPNKFLAVSLETYFTLNITVDLGSVISLFLFVIPCFFDLFKATESLTRLKDKFFLNICAVQFTDLVLPCYSISLFNSSQFKFSFNNSKFVITSDIGSATRSGVANRSFELRVNKQYGQFGSCVNRQVTSMYSYGYPCEGTLLKLLLGY